MLNDSIVDLDLVIKRSGVKKDMVIGDFGCGSGFFSRKLSKLVSNTGCIYAVDVMKDVLLNLQRICNLEGIQNIKTIWSNLEIYGATLISDASLDLGFIINTFFQSQQEQDFLREVLRMVKINGKVIIVDWVDEAVSTIAPNSKDRTGIEKIRKICKNLGNLKEVDLFQPDKNHYCIVLEKLK